MGNNETAVTTRPKSNLAKFDVNKNEKVEMIESSAIKQGSLNEGQKSDVKNVVSPSNTIKSVREKALASAKSENKANSDGDILATDDSKVDERKIPDPFQGGIEFLVNPSLFFVSQSAENEEFEEILLAIQDSSEKLNVAKVGTVCGAYMDEFVQRVRIDKISVDGATASVFLIDEGRVLSVPTKDLVKLCKYKDVPGLAIKCGLAGLQPLRDGKWSDEAIQYFSALSG